MFKNVKITKQHYLKNYSTDLNKISLKRTGNLENPQLLNFMKIEHVVQKLWQETCSEDCLISLMFLRDGCTDFHKISVKWKVYLPHNTLLNFIVIGL